MNTSHPTMMRATTCRQSRFTPLAVVAAAVLAAGCDGEPPAGVELSVAAQRASRSESPDPLYSGPLPFALGAAASVQMPASKVSPVTGAGMVAGSSSLNGVLSPNSAYLSCADNDCEDGLACTVEKCVVGIGCVSVDDHASCQHGGAPWQMRIPGKEYVCDPGSSPPAGGESGCAVATPEQACQLGGSICQLSEWESAGPLGETGGAFFRCELRMAAASSDCFEPFPASQSCRAVNLGASLFYDPDVLAFQGFFDEVCITPSVCFVSAIGDGYGEEPSVSTLNTGHTVAMAPILSDWDQQAGGGLILADFATGGAPLTDAYVDGSVVHGDSKVLEIWFRVLGDPEAAFGARVCTLAPLATGGWAQPMDIDIAADGVLVVHPTQAD